MSCASCLPPSPSCSPRFVPPALPFPFQPFFSSSLRCLPPCPSCLFFALSLCHLLSSRPPFPSSILACPCRSVSLCRPSSRCFPYGFLPPRLPFSLQDVPQAAVCSLPPNAFCSLSFATRFPRHPPPPALKPALLHKKMFPHAATCKTPFPSPSFLKSACGLQRTLFAGQRLRRPGRQPRRLEGPCAAPGQLTRWRSLRGSPRCRRDGSPAIPSLVRPSGL